MKPVHGRHVQIEDERFRLKFHDPQAGFKAVRAGTDIISFAGQPSVQLLLKALVIVHHQEGTYIQPGFLSSA
jgi:hypothetical protein